MLFDFLTMLHCVGLAFSGVLTGQKPLHERDDVKKAFGEEKQELHPFYHVETSFVAEIFARLW